MCLSQTDAATGIPTQEKTLRPAVPQLVMAVSVEENLWTGHSDIN